MHDSLANFLTVVLEWIRNFQYQKLDEFHHPELWNSCELKNHCMKNFYSLCENYAERVSFSTWTNPLVYVRGHDYMYIFSYILLNKEEHFLTKKYNKRHLPEYPVWWEANKQNSAWNKTKKLQGKKPRRKKKTEKNQCRYRKKTKKNNVWGKSACSHRCI